MGNLTRDPELRVTANGNSICKFGIATNRKYTPQNGPQVEETTFIDIDCFGKQAETISKYMSKGNPIMLEGRLKFDTWESKTGEKRSKLGVVMENFQFIGGRNESAGSPYEESSPPPRAAAAPAQPAPAHDDIDDDVPF